MATTFEQKRRDFTNKKSSGSIEIKSIVQGQKPTCVIEIFRYAVPNETKLALLNVNKPSGATRVNAEGRVFQIDNDIVKCTVHKNKNSSSGGFSLILKRGNKGDSKETANSLLTANPIDYLKLISPGDWIAIYMRADGSITFDNSLESGLKMLGIIENVRYVEVDEPETGRPRFEYVITGRDFGKLLENQVYFNPVINGLEDIRSIMGGDFNTYVQNTLKQRSAQSPDQICKALLSYFLADGGNSLTSNTTVFRIPSTLQQRFGGSGKFSQILDTSFMGLQKFSNGVFTAAGPLLGKAIPTAFPPDGSIWSYLQMYSNPALNEMFVDLAKKGNKLVPTVQLRQLPLSHDLADETSIFRSGGLSSSVGNGEKTLFKDLPQHKIKSTDIKQKNIGKSQFERINAVVVVPQVPLTGGQEIRAAYAMMFNSPSVQKYGLNLLRLNTIFTADQDFKTYSQKVTELVSDFFMNAHAFYNGTIVTDGTDDFVQVGINLYIEDLKQLFHIEGVSYNYEINQETGTTSYDTEFRVSHGQVLSLGKLDFIGSQADPSGRAKEIPEKLEYATIPSAALENIRNTKPKLS